MSTIGNINGNAQSIYQMLGQLNGAAPKASIDGDADSSATATVLQGIDTPPGVSTKA